MNKFTLDNTTIDCIGFLFGDIVDYNSSKLIYEDAEDNLIYGVIFYLNGENLEIHSQMKFKNVNQALEWMNHG